MSVTRRALQAGINVCRPGVPFKEIGRAIHDLVKNPIDGYDYCISAPFAGHGIGKAFHREPAIVHTRKDLPFR
jgi:methionyl aminopeptidase